MLQVFVLGDDPSKSKENASVETVGQAVKMNDSDLSCQPKSNGSDNTNLIVGISMNPNQQTNTGEPETSILSNENSSKQNEVSTLPLSTNTQSTNNTRASDEKPQDISFSSSSVSSSSSLDITIADDNSNTHPDNNTESKQLNLQIEPKKCNGESNAYTHPMFILFKVRIIASFHF